MKIRGWRLRAYCALPDLKLSRLNQPGRPGNTRPPPFGGSYHVASLEPPPASHAVTSGGVAESYRTTKSSQCDSLVPRRVRPRVRVRLDPSSWTSVDPVAPRRDMPRPSTKTGRRSSTA